MMTPYALSSDEMPQLVAHAERALLQIRWRYFCHPGTGSVSDQDAETIRRLAERLARLERVAEDLEATTGNLQIVHRTIHTVWDQLGQDKDTDAWWRFRDGEIPDYRKEQEEARWQITELMEQGAAHLRADDDDVRRPILVHSGHRGEDWAAAFAWFAPPVVPRQDGSGT